jgi:hypothetical protein
MNKFTIKPSKNIGPPSKPEGNIAHNVLRSLTQYSPMRDYNSHMLVVYERVGIWDCISSS